MKRTVTAATLALCLGILATGTAIAQTANDLVGTWTSTSNINILQDGNRTNIFGPRGTGTAVFESNGRFAIININPDTPKFAANNRAQGTAEENKAAVLGGIALYGTYTVIEKTFTSRSRAVPIRTGLAPTRSARSSLTRVTSSSGMFRHQSAAPARSLGSA